MKKLLVIIPILLVAAAIGTGFYFYRQVAYQPSWYTAGQSRGEPLSTAGIPELDERIRQDLARGKTVTVPADRLVALAAARIEAQTGFKIGKMLKGHRLTITQGGIEAEMILDAGMLPMDKFPADARKLMDRVLDKLPSGTLRNLYVRTRLKPVLEKGILNLDPSSGLSVGKMDLPVEKLVEALGENGKIPLSRFPVGDFKLAEDALVLIPKGKTG